MTAEALSSGFLSTSAPFPWQRGAVGLFYDEWRVYLDAAAAQTKLKSRSSKADLGCESRTGVPADGRLSGRPRHRRCRRRRPSQRGARTSAAWARPSLWVETLRQGEVFQMQGQKSRTWKGRQGGTNVCRVPASGLRLRF